MRSLFLLIQQYRVFLLFISLEALCFWLIVRNNTYHNATFFNSANVYVGTMLSWSNGVSQYFNLTQVNRDLVSQNARLEKQIQQFRAQSGQKIPARFNNAGILSSYEFIPAQVINNSTSRPNNYITIDKGKLHGIEPKMAVISPLGVVGKVVSCSNHFSTIMSVLHVKNRVSAQLLKNNELGSLIWEGKNPRVAKLIEVPVNNTIKIVVGDTIVASGYNSLFPPRTPIGIIKKVSTKAGQTFYDIDVELATNFNSLAYVFVIKNILKVEQEKLEMETFEEIDE
jgi:rod shape-determining protein MreC